MENDTFVGFNFVMGEECGAVDREAKVSKFGYMMLLYMYNIIVILSNLKTLRVVLLSTA